jgi:hypothetical protein
MEKELRYWDEVFGYKTESRIDKRWVLRSNVDELAHGSLRIVSHPDLKPGHLRAYASFVTKRRKKQPEELEKLKEEYKIEDIELEAYSIDYDIETVDREYVDTYQKLEETFGVEIFKRRKK